jgi:Domain of unknown function (DUF4262)
MNDNADEASRNAFRQDTDEDIRHSGRSIIFGFSCEENGPQFAHTIGNHLKALPELLIIGTTQGACLNDLSQMMIKSGNPFLDGQLVRINAGRLPVKIIRANNTAQADYTLCAGDYFGHQDYAVMQVIMPDRTGKFPGEDGCQEPYSLLPVLRLD